MSQRSGKHAGIWAILAFAAVIALEVVICAEWHENRQLAAISEEDCGMSDSLGMDSSATEAVASLPPPNARDWTAIDSHALAAPAHEEVDVHTLACYLAAPAHDDWERARAIYRWMADRIRYDDAAFNSGHYGLHDPQMLLRLRRGVCDDYADLFCALALEVGIPAKKIDGFSKGFSSLERHHSLEPDHAWNAFQIDGAWHLTDVTWAAGFGEMRGRILHSTQRFEPYWFAPPPDEFVFLHLPSEGRWQLLDTTLSAADFECLPAVTADYFKAGFSSAPLLAQLRAGLSTEQVRVYGHDYDVRKVVAPAERNIALGDSLQLQFVCSECASMSAHSGGRFLDFERSDSLFCLDLKPRKGALRIFARRQRYARRYDGVMEYWVGK